MSLVEAPECVVWQCAEEEQMRLLVPPKQPQPKKVLSETGSSVAKMQPTKTA